MAPVGLGTVAADLVERGRAGAHPGSAGGCGAVHRPGRPDRQGGRDPGPAGPPGDTASPAYLPISLARARSASEGRAGPPGAHASPAYLRTPCPARAAAAGPRPLRIIG